MAIAIPLGSHFLSLTDPKLCPIAREDPKMPPTIQNGIAEESESAFPVSILAMFSQIAAVGAGRTEPPISYAWVYSRYAIAEAKTEQLKD